MNKLWLAAVVCAALASSCKKDTPPAEPPNEVVAKPVVAPPPVVPPEPKKDVAVAPPPELHFDDGFDAAAQKAITAVYVAAKAKDATALESHVDPQFAKTKLAGFKKDPSQLSQLTEAILHGCTTDDVEDAELAKGNEESIHCPSDADEEAADIPGFSLHFEHKAGNWLLTGMEKRGSDVAE